MTATNYCNDNDSIIIAEAECLYGTVNAQTYADAAWNNYAENARAFGAEEQDFEFNEDDFKAAAFRYFEHTCQL